MSKDRKIDDAELAKISGAGEEAKFNTGGGSGSSGGFAEAPDPGVPGDPTNPDTDDQDGGENTFG